MKVSVIILIVCVFAFIQAASSEEGLPSLTTFPDPICKNLGNYGCNLECLKLCYAKGGRCTLFNQCRCFGTPRYDPVTGLCQN